MIKNLQFTIYNLLKARKSRGFTLVELLTAISIFAIIMTISLGSILGIFDANRKTRAMKNVVSNLNLALEGMAKEIRFGRDYHCGQSGQDTSPQNCPSGDTYFSFLDSEGSQVTYRFMDQSLEKRVGTEQYIAITAPEVAIDSGEFYTIGSGTGDTLQPKVLLVIKAHSGTGKSRTDIVLQTLVSQRYLDI